MFRRILIVLILAPALVRADRGTTQISHDSFDLPRLIEALSDPDWTVRKQASERLALMGPAARPELIRASRSDNPEQRARAAQILRKLPWTAPDDPPAIRQLLDRYGPVPDAVRQQIIVRLSDVPGGGPVLLRLLDEEPSDGVRWFIVASLFDTADPQMQKRLRELDVTSDDPPVLMLAGSAWLKRDRPKALGLLRRAVNADQFRPGNDLGFLTIAFDLLTDTALREGNFDAAAELLRKQVPRDAMLPPHGRGDFPSADGVSLARVALLQSGMSLEQISLLQTRMTMRRLPGDSRIPNLAALTALHRYFGPLRGFDKDQRTWGRGSGGSDTVANRVATLLYQLGSAPPLPGEQRIDLSPDDRYAAAAFLVQHKYTAAAELELRGALASGKKMGPVVEFNLVFLLARTVAENGKDDEAANLIERAMRVKLNNNLQLNDNTVDDDIRAEIHWRRARAAQERGDHDAANQHIRNLGQCLPSNNDTTISAIRWLKETNREQLAKVMFDKVYESSHDKLAGGLADSDAGVNNDLAWLCARCGERLDEAIRFAQAAVNTSPDTAAYIDTLAEANYRKGNRDEAVRLETRALELSPDNDFMRQQLERYKSGKP